MPSGPLHEQILLRMNRGTSPGPEEGGGVGGRDAKVHHMSP